MISEQLAAALRRSFVTAAGAFILAASTTYLVTHDMNKALGAGITAALAPIFLRGAGEGIYDTQRAIRGDVRPSDVSGRP